jgi:hypothetical protein
MSLPFIVVDRAVPAARLFQKIFILKKNSELLFSGTKKETRVRQVTRGERPLGHRGGAGNTGHGIRGSNDERWDHADPMHDPYRYLRDEDEERSYPANDEYIWPTPDDEEDD